MSLLFSSITIGLVIAALLFAISFLYPDFTGLPSQLTDSITATSGYINAFSFLFPFANMMVALGIVLVFEVAVLVMKFVFWLIRTIRGGGS
jgi:hypothetical protein